jgi:hypothetical protein
MTTMNKPNFPALVFMFLGWMAIATITGIIIFVWHLPKLGRMPTAQPISAATLAPIFEDVASTTVPDQDQPQTVPTRKRKHKPAPTISGLIQSEAKRKAS